MTPNLELVKPSERERARGSGPSCGSIGVFVGSVVAVASLAFMLALGFFVADMRENAKLLDLKVQTLQKEIAYMKGRLDEKEELKP